MNMRKQGFSLIETLVVVAIICIMLAVALPHYWKAIRLAKQTAADEAKRQEQLVPYAPAYTISPEMADWEIRETARAAFRHTIDAGKFDLMVTQPLLEVRNDEEFRAYYFTLVDAEATAPLLFEGGSMIVRTPEGTEFRLRTSDAIEPGGRDPYAIAWDFLSTNMANMSVGSFGVGYVRSNGERPYVKYPGEFPATETVARLGQRFMDEVCQCGPDEPY
ncbi:MAG: type II secretion system protein [Candidatus Hydrogenedentes bacterium]|nr:type II secretion system protein [Candidatus Hydrogenedentota bacterium]